MKRRGWQQRGKEEEEEEKEEKAEKEEKTEDHRKKTFLIFNTV